MTGVKQLIFLTKKVIFWFWPFGIVILWDCVLLLLNMFSFSLVWKRFGVWLLLVYSFERAEGEVFFWQIMRSILPKGHQLWLCLDSPIQLKVHDDFDQWLFNQLQWLIGDSQVTLDVWANTIYGTNNKRNWPNLCGFETPCQFGAILWLLPSLS